MSLSDISMRAGLEIWSELEQCYYDDNGYGGTTAEIYAYRLRPDQPGRDMAFSRTESVENDKKAAEALVGLCCLFACLRECRVVFKTPGRWIGPKAWLRAHGRFDHPVHVQVIHKRNRTREAG